MELAYFVRVLPGPAGVAMGGTGYLIARDRVLTAAHVVGGAESVTVEYDTADGSEVRVTSAEVAWSGSGDCDMALLRLSEPVAFEVVVPRLDHEPLTTATPWESRGWALASAEAERVQDSMVDLLGEASAFRPSQQRAQLTIDLKPSRIDLWRGISGAPVFERGRSGHLLGVVTAAPESFVNVLWATPLTAAFRQGGEELLAALGTQVARERRERLRADLIDLLARDETQAAKAIAGRRRPWTDRLRDGGVVGLADELLASDAGDTLLELVKMHSHLARAGGGERKEARTIEDVVARIAPLLVQRSYLHALPPGRSGGVLLRLPVGTTTVAELVMAGFEGRPSRLIPVAGGFPEGAYRLPLPTAEAGLDIAGDASLESYARHLEATFLTSDEQRHAARLRMTESDGHRLAREWVFRQVDGLFELQADLAAWQARRYLLYDSHFTRDNAVFLRELAARMPSIHRIEMTEDDPAGESRICRLLQTLLGRSSSDDDDEEET